MHLYVSFRVTEFIFPYIFYNVICLFLYLKSNDNVCLITLKKLNEFIANYMKKLRINWCTKSLDQKSLKTSECHVTISYKVCLIKFVIVHKKILITDPRFYLFLVNSSKNINKNIYH